jgi:hypothetical protein
MPDRSRQDRDRPFKKPFEPLAPEVARRMGKEPPKKGGC